MRQLPHLAQHQFTSDTVYALEEPYEWSMVLNVSNTGSTGFVSPNGDLAHILRIEVPDGDAVRYEINPPARVVLAGNASPKLTGSDVFPWAIGYTVSLIDAAAFQ